ncbi:putative T7SS-secreted protein [Streptomyces griseomycini]|uniref:Putative T7SS secretion signal domain-containing protein n=1 Tax=Streptomyces griseomycini TaxID=66895 RepID=A0A7W7PRC2_9ACTN|nr:hypothetical protein [Streptomyces griseomycini]MBB4897740.1 hypothetical protein [Streptomyces griseomycini]GGQ20426.1 hypothetical protein GCM10010266_49470 [Streptomyces griseomycini]GGR11710.1 hypothetical protein GCM10015536_16520 [Streptomyces griseomycini]
MSASSKPRPRDWHPLAESDPVPGDAEEIRDEVKHMKSVASALRDQAERLRKIKNDDELKGKYAGKLREDSEVLEKHLREVASRYERVHVHLSNWANDLEYYQGEADKVLANAKKEQEQLDAEKAKKDSGDSDTPKPSESETEGDPLHKYRTQLSGITRDRDERAGHYAKKIREEIDDIIEDSFWDDIKGWIHDNVDAIKLVLDLAGWAATFLGMLAPFLAFIPIIGQIVIAISIFVALSRFIMFLAGEASLTEVFVDCIGLMAFGAGLKMLGKLKVANSAVKTASKAQRTTRLKDAVRANKAAREEISRVLATTSDDGLKSFARDSLNRLRREILDNAGRVTDEAPVSLNRFEKIGLGNSDARALMENIRRNADAFPESGAEALGKSQNYYRAAVTAAVTGTAADLTDKALGESPLFPGKPFYAPYEDGKGEFIKLPEDTHW